MPYIDVTTSSSPGLPSLDRLAEDVTALVEKHLDKPEDVTMVHVSAGQRLRFKGNHEPAAHVAIRAIGLAPAEKRAALVSAICELFDGVLDVPATRTLIVFEEYPGDRWGVDGGLYGA